MSMSIASPHVRPVTTGVQFGKLEYKGENQIILTHDEGKGQYCTKAIVGVNPNNKTIGIIRRFNKPIPGYEPYTRVLADVYGTSRHATDIGFLDSAVYRDLMACGFDRQETMEAIEWTRGKKKALYTTA
jgi:hypothetical protein